MGRSEFEFQEGFWGRWAGLRVPRRPIGELGFELQTHVGGLSLFSPIRLLVHHRLEICNFVFSFYFVTVCR